MNPKLQTIVGVLILLAFLGISIYSLQFFYPQPPQNVTSNNLTSQDLEGLIPIEKLKEKINESVKVKGVVVYHRHGWEFYIVDHTGAVPIKSPDGDSIKDLEKFKKFVNETVIAEGKVLLYHYLPFEVYTPRNISGEYLEVHSINVTDEKMNISEIEPKKVNSVGELMENMEEYLGEFVEVRGMLVYYSVVPIGVSPLAIKDETGSLQLINSRGLELEEFFNKEVSLRGFFLLGYNPMMPVYIEVLQVEKINTSEIEPKKVKNIKELVENRWEYFGEFVEVRGKLIRLNLSVVPKGASPLRIKDETGELQLKNSAGLELEGFFDKEVILTGFFLKGYNPMIPLYIEIVDVKVAA